MLSDDNIVLHLSNYDSYDNYDDLEPVTITKKNRRFMSLPNLGIFKNWNKNRSKKSLLSETLDRRKVEDKIWGIIVGQKNIDWYSIALASVTYDLSEPLSMSLTHYNYWYDPKQLSRKNMNYSLVIICSQKGHVCSLKILYSNIIFEFDWSTHANEIGAIAYANNNHDIINWIIDIEDHIGKLDYEFINQYNKSK